MNHQFLEILFAEEIRPGDLEIIRPATGQRPGRARLSAAYLGPVHPDAPNSTPVFSRTGAKIGFIAGETFAPYDTVYRLETASSATT